jgi:16S rRNA (adenine1518-N6/adenine1519-N6)-dimethyltransferase
MVEAASLDEDDDVVEVGAGLGALTGRLADQARRVLAVEIDRTFMPCLEDQFGGMDQVTLFRGDILNHELDKLVEEYLPGTRRLKMVSNLPYYITTPVLFHFWEEPVFFERLVVMTQEEVARRMTAQPDSADYGVLTLASQYYARVDIVRRVPRTCFRPQPKVDSSIVRMRMRTEPPVADVDAYSFLRVVRAAFAKRRKTLRNALLGSPELELPAGHIDAALEGGGIDPMRRAQTLSMAEFAGLARRLVGGEGDG